MHATLHNFKLKTMTTRNFLTAGGIVALFFGIVLIFTQDAFAKMDLTDHILSANARAFSANFGIVLASVGIGTLAARNSIPSAAHRGFVIQFTIACLLLAGFDIHNIIAGVNSNGE